MKKEILYFNGIVNRDKRRIYNCNNNGKEGNSNSVKEYREKSEGKVREINRKCK